MRDSIESGCASDLKATITDGRGTELLSFQIASNERFIISSAGGKPTFRKLAKDDHYWSKETLVEVVREMTAKN